MRRTLAAALIVVTTGLVAPASAGNPVKEWLDECMDCIPSRCQILNTCDVRP